MDYPDHKLVNGVRVPLTQAEIDDIITFWQENEAQAQKILYKTKRSAEYPTIADQMDMIWHAMDAGLLPKDNPFYQSIQAVKLKYPKPKEVRNESINESQPG